MTQAFFIFMAIKILATIACIILSLKIAKTAQAPTSTYTLFAIGYIIMFVNQLLTLFFSDTIVQFLESYDPFTYISTQLLSALVFFCHYLAFQRKWNAVNFINTQNEHSKS